MPLNPGALTPIITVQLFAAGNIGSGAPKLAAGLANGVCGYFGLSAKAVTIDNGTLGVGTSTGPLNIPPPAMLTALLIGYAAQGLLGPMAPLNALGVANGLSIGLLSLSLAIIQHPGIGSGACIMRIVGSSAIPAFIAGYAAAGMVSPGSVKHATAVGIGFDTLFQSFIMPLPIVGPPTPSGGAGVGFGVIV